jgi:(S)-mandelate dehydrogenase
LSFIVLAAAGQAGVDHVLRLLKDEVDRTRAQIGCPEVGRLSLDFLTADATDVMTS